MEALAADDFGQKASCELHGQWVNLPPKIMEVEHGHIVKETNLGDTPIFHFHGCGGTGNLSERQLTLQQ